MPRENPKKVLDNSHRPVAIFDRVTIPFDTSPTFDDSATTMERMKIQSERLLFLAAPEGSQHTLTELRNYVRRKLPCVFSFLKQMWGLL